ncbi:MAG: hypothetical protein Q8P67_25075, partial [archaeon]|nr:hypothetical protein [archaeon]
PDLFCLLVLPPVAARFVIPTLSHLFAVPPPELVPIFTKLILSHGEITAAAQVVLRIAPSYPPEERLCISVSPCYLQMSRKQRPSQSGDRDFFLPPPPHSFFSPLSSPSFIHAQHINS